VVITQKKSLHLIPVVLCVGIILYFGETLFVPLFFGLLIAIVLHPVCKWLETHGWKKSFAIAACLLMVTIIFILLAWLLIWQIKLFSKDAPIIINKLNSFLQQVQTWLFSHHMNTNDIRNNWAEEITGIIGTLVGSTLQTTANLLFMLFLIPVFAALFMYHRKVFVTSLRLMIPDKYHSQLQEILSQTIHTYFNYIKGMIMVYAIVGALNSIGLFALGVRHALAFGMICAVMTIIPYIGIGVSALLPISVVWIETGNIWYPIGVIAVFGIVQYLEANIIFPAVVGVQLNVSTLAMLIAVILGGIIWGISGMILFIPFVAILKIISDNIEEWKPLNLLLSR